jgi:hypothetical protein
VIASISALIIDSDFYVTISFNAYT